MENSKQAKLDTHGKIKLEESAFHPKRKYCPIKDAYCEDNCNFFLKGERIPCVLLGFLMTAVIRTSEIADYLSKIVDILKVRS